MNILEPFLAYATDFEKTLADDDWSRVEPYFAEHAVYRVESNFFGCELEGAAAIFAGMKKSLDGFDRHFPARKIDITEGPTVDGKIELLVDSYDDAVKEETAKWVAQTGVVLDPSYA